MDLGPPLVTEVSSSGGQEVRVPLQTPHCDADRGRTARVPVRRRSDGEIEIAQPVEIVFETTRSRTPTRFFFGRVRQPFVVNLLCTTVY